MITFRTLSDEDFPQLYQSSLEVFADHYILHPTERGRISQNETSLKL